MEFPVAYPFSATDVSEGERRAYVKRPGACSKLFQRRTNTRQTSEPPTLKVGNIPSRDKAPHIHQPTDQEGVYYTKTNDPNVPMPADHRMCANLLPLYSTTKTVNRDDAPRDEDSAIYIYALPVRTLTASGIVSIQRAMMMMINPSVPGSINTHTHGYPDLIITG